MASDTSHLDQKIEEIESRVTELRRQWPDVPRVRPHPPEPFDQALEDLTTSLDALHLLHQELLERNQELADLHAAVEAERQRYRDLFTFAPDGYLLTDTEGRITEVNRAVLDLLQLPQCHVTGQALHSFVVPEDQARLSMLMVEAQVQPRTLGREVRIARPGRPPIPCEVRVMCVRGRENRPTGCRWMLRDLTEYKALETHATEATDRERQRIGQELHDGLGQQLSAIGMMAKALEDEAPPDLVGRARELAGAVQDAVKYVRAVCRGIMPLGLGEEELHIAVARLAGTISRLYGVRCEVRCDRPPDLHDPAAVEHLFRILQEAVHNAVRHAQPQRIVIELQRTDDALVVRVSDDGRGLPEPGLLKPGLGLRTMQHRAERIGAEFHLEPVEGGGTRVVCRVPCQGLPDDGPC